jgi:hypothetical protein
MHSVKIGLSLFILTLLSIPHSAYAGPVESELDCSKVKEGDLTEGLCAEINSRAGFACNRPSPPKDCDRCVELQTVCGDRGLGGDPPGFTAPDPVASRKIGK